MERPLLVCKLCEKLVPEGALMIHTHLRAHHPQHPTMLNYEESIRELAVLEEEVRGLEALLWEELKTLSVLLNKVDPEEEVNMGEVDHEMEVKMEVDLQDQDQDEDDFFPLTNWEEEEGGSNPHPHPLPFVVGQTTINVEKTEVGDNHENMGNFLTPQYLPIAGGITVQIVCEGGPIAVKQKQKGEEALVPKPLHVSYRFKNRDSSFPCPFCGEQFSQLCYLDRHKKAHGPGYPCPLCPTTTNEDGGKESPVVSFWSKHSLRTHKDRFHNGVRWKNGVKYLQTPKEAFLPGGKYRKNARHSQYESKNAVLDNVPSRQGSESAHDPICQILGTGQNVQDEDSDQNDPENVQNANISQIRLNYPPPNGIGTEEAPDTTETQNATTIPRYSLRQSARIVGKNAKNDENGAVSDSDSDLYSLPSDPDSDDFNIDLEERLKAKRRKKRGNPPKSLVPKRAKTSEKPEMAKNPETPEPLLTMGNQRTFPCGVCGEEFSLLIYLNHHRRAHGVGHACSFCGASFWSKNSLRAHRDRVHRGIRWLYGKKIKAAPKFFTSAAPLIEPFEPGRRRPRPRPQTRPVKGTTDQNAGSRTPKTFPCTLCGEQFTLQIYLNKHNQGHGPGPECKHCGASFRSKYSLRSHTDRFHNGIRWKNGVKTIETPKAPIQTPPPPTSSLVTEEGAGGGVVQQGQIVPMLQTNFPCPDCGEVFKQQIYLERHLKAHGPGNVCHYCGTSFKLPYTLRSHKDRFHRGIRWINGKKTYSKPDAPETPEGNSRNGNLEDDLSLEIVEYPQISPPDQNQSNPNFYEELKGGNAEEVLFEVINNPSHPPPGPNDNNSEKEGLAFENTPVLKIIENVVEQSTFGIMPTLGLELDGSYDNLFL